MKISFKDIEENVKTPKEYKEGVYQVKVVNATDGTANSGTEYLEVEFETMGEEVFKVRKRFYKTSKALSILLNFLSAVGIYDDKSKDDVDFENEDLLGAVLQVEFVKGEENEQGKRYLELKSWSCKAVSGLATPTKKPTPKKVEEVKEESVPF